MHGAMGRAHNGHGVGARRGQHRRDPVLPGRRRGHDLRGHALYPGVVVHRARAGEEVRHLHGLGVGRDDDWGLYPDGDPVVAAYAAWAERVEVVVHVSKVLS